MFNEKELKSKALWVRKKVLEMARAARSGHVTSAFSQTELLVALYYSPLLRHDPQNPGWGDRDRFILSKGQGGIGLYPILADRGYFPVEVLSRFAQEGNILGVHAESNIPGVEIITGSLGHGLPIAVGMAQAARNDGKKHLIYCLLGDAELYEGSNWEAATIAGHYKYGNLICIVDRNRQGVLGFTDEVLTPKDGPRLDSLKAKFEAFGFETREIDGHSFPEIFSALQDVRDRISKAPLMVIANTEKGHGSTLMANQRMWHYRVPTEQELKNILMDLEGGDSP